MSLPCSAQIFWHLWSRFHQISSFGKGAIRRFPSSVSEAHQCVARHFEDVLQVSTVHDDCALLGLMFDPVHYACIWGPFSFWTRSSDPNVTVSTGTMACPCKVATSHWPLPQTPWQSFSATRGSVAQISGFHLHLFKTVELTSETATRWREKARRLDTTLPGSSKTSATSAARPKLFNLATYKLHALGDYVHSIHLFGTTDSYTTQLVSNFCFSGHQETKDQNDRLILITRESNPIAFSRVSTKVRTRKTQWDSWQHKNGDIHISKGKMYMTVLKPAWWIQMKQPLNPFDPITFCQVHQTTLLIWPNILFNTEVMLEL